MDADELTRIYAIFTDVRLDVENRQPAKVYAENAAKIRTIYEDREKSIKEKAELEAKISILTSLPDTADEEYVSVDYIMYLVGECEDRLAKLRTLHSTNNLSVKEKD